MNIVPIGKLVSRKREVAFQWKGKTIKYTSQETLFLVSKNHMKRLQETFVACPALPEGLPA